VRAGVNVRFLVLFVFRGFFLLFLCVLVLFVVIFLCYIQWYAGTVLQWDGASKLTFKITGLGSRHVPSPDEPEVIPNRHVA
jgi:hypothetical protein